VRLRSLGILADALKPINPQGRSGRDPDPEPDPDSDPPGVARCESRNRHL